MQILRQGKTPENYDVQAEVWEYKDGSKNYTVAMYPIVEGCEARVWDYVPNERTALAILDEFIAGTKTFAEVKSVRKDGCLGHIISSTVGSKSNV